MIQAKKTYLAGFSGGADSTAALLWALENLHGRSGKVIAVHFNHHLRCSESDAEAESAAGFAAAANVEFRLVDLSIAPGCNLEARARYARLEAWKKLCGEYENPVVVTGHHQDDCIENMFLRIGRGSNVSGLTGLQLYSEVNGVKFFRPLLNMSRREIEDFLRSRGVDKWAEDSSNSSCDYSRNMLRNRILPEYYRIFPGGRKAVVQTLNNLADDAAALDRMAQAFFDNAGEEHFEIPFWRLYAGERALAVRMLRLLCGELFQDNAPVTPATFERFLTMTGDGSKGTLVLDKNRTLIFSGERIYAAAETPGPLLWQWRKCPQLRWGNWLLTAEKAEMFAGKAELDEAYFDMETLPDMLTVGAARPGDRMLPFGGNEPVKVKKLRIDRKIPALPVLPVLRDGAGKVLWLPLIRHSAHCPARPDGETVRIFAEKVQ